MDWMRIVRRLFGHLGVLPTYGRLLDEGDCKPGAEAVAVLGYGYWQARFGSDPSIVGLLRA
jgi:hypothetical protein